MINSLKKTDWIIKTCENQFHTKYFQFIDFYKTKFNCQVKSFLTKYLTNSDINKSNDKRCSYQ